MIGAGVTTARPPHAPAPASQTAPTVRPTGDRGGGPVPPRWQRNVWRALWRNAGPAVVALRVAGLGYHHPSAEDAWARILRFFAEHLGDGAPGSPPG